MAAIRCTGSGRQVAALPGRSYPERVACPHCGRDVATSAAGRLRPHNLEPVLRGVSFDRQREKWVGAVQNGAVMYLFDGRSKGAAFERATSGLREIRKAVAVAIVVLVAALGAVPAPAAEASPAAFEARAPMLSIPRARAALAREFRRMDVGDRILRCRRRFRRRVDCKARATFVVEETDGSLEKGEEITVDMWWPIVLRGGKAVVL